MRTGRSRFAQRHKANFGQTVSHGGYDVEIPARPFLPIRNGQVDLPEWERQILDSIAWTLEDSLR